MTGLLIVLFLLFLLIGVPLAFIMGMAGTAVLLIDGSYPLALIPQRMFNGINSFPLMAVPFFILAADFMTAGRLTSALLELCRSLVGHIRGGMGHVNVLVSVLFAGISGSALADAAGPGAVAMRMMSRAGYPLSYSAALSACTATIGPIIPPSIIMVVYAISDASVSVAGLFLAGILPGLLMGGALAAANAWISRKKGYGGERRYDWKARLSSFRSAMPAIIMPLIILSGILSGIFTATEAASVAVVYALLVGFLRRTLSLAMLPSILLRSGIITSAVLMIVATASLFAWLLTVNQVPQMLGATIQQLDLGTLGTLLVISAMVFVCAMFIDTIPAVIILTPILAPVAAHVGIDPTHFAIVLMLNLTIGMVTPPVGPVLFVMSTVGRIPLETLTGAVLPLLLIQLLVLLLIIGFPPITLWIPSVFGY